MKNCHEEQMKGGGRSCCVVGCKNRTTVSQGKHFYKFPKNQPFRDLWRSFTRRGNDFDVKAHSTICQDHFNSSCFSYKKKQVRLLNESVPTIFERETSNGIEQVVLTFNTDVQCFVEDTLLRPAYDREKHESELIRKQSKRLAEVKRSCRFCFDDPEEGEKNFVEINKLKNYSIRPDDVFNLIGLSTQNADVISNFMCEECFQHIITFDGFKKRCCKTYETLINELKDLDKSLQKLRGLQPTQSSWWKSEAVWDGEESLNDDNFDNESDDFTFPDKRDCISRANTSFQRVMINEEAKGKTISDDDFLIPSIEVNDEMNENELVFTIPSDEHRDVHDQVQNDKTDFIAELEAKEPEPPTPGPLFNDIFNPSDVSNVIKDQDRQVFATRIYECFFCRLKFAGKKTLRYHECQVKQAKCPAEGCEKLFTKMSGFNTHITKLHKLPKITRLFCKVCKLSMISTEQEFKQHCRMCEKSSNTKVSKHSVTCKICHKVCPNLQSFSVHMMFHKSTDPKAEPKTKWQRRMKKGVFICETCGKEFEYSRYLSHHIKRLHLTVENPITYTCDHCGKTRTNRSNLAKHIRNVHRNNPTPCKVCGKVFRNKALVQAHMLYHTDRKRIHFCSLCPDKPPWFTAVALKRHQESNHGYGPGYKCDICEAFYRTRTGLNQHKTSAHKSLNCSVAGRAAP